MGRWHFTHLMSYDMNVNENERLSNITLKHKLKEQLVARNNMGVNEHKLLSNIPLRY